MAIPTRKADLRDAPPSLAAMFPDLSTMQEKSWRFLELYHELRTYRRLGEHLGVHHNTVKNIYDFLQGTDVYYQFQGQIADQTEDFFSSANLTNLWETYQKEIRRLEKMIAEYMQRDTDSARQQALKVIKEKRMFLKDVLVTSMACRGYFKKDKGGDKKEDPTNDFLRQHEALLEEAEDMEDDITGFQN